MAKDRPLHEVLRRLERALDTMEPLPLAVFERHRYRDLDYRQIAAELDLTVDEVERHFAAAMLHLMQHTRQDGGL